MAKFNSEIYLKLVALFNDMETLKLGGQSAKEPYMWELMFKYVHCKVFMLLRKEDIEKTLEYSKNQSEGARKWSL